MARDGAVTVLRTRLLVLLAGHLFALAILLFAFLPAREGNVRTVQGNPVPFRSCSSRNCDEGIRIGEITLACSVDPIGTQYSCPHFYRPGRPAAATYFPMDTLLSAMRLGSPPNILLRLEQDGVVVWERSVSQLRRTYFSPGSWLLVVAFAASFFLLANRPFFKR